LAKRKNKEDEKKPRILLFGYGNPGRQDDGLGNEFIYHIERWIDKEDLKWVETDSSYQLNIEDADAIAHKDIVVFIDASTEDIPDIMLARVDPSDARAGFSMHSVSASFVLSLCQKLYDKYPETYLLHIKGYEWELGEGLTPKATENLAKALDFVKNKLKNPPYFADKSE
jgi:hydrogenase maturation protease